MGRGRDGDPVTAAMPLLMCASAVLALAHLGAYLTLNPTSEGGSGGEGEFEKQGSKVAWTSEFVIEKPE